MHRLPALLLALCCGGVPSPAADAPMFVLLDGEGPEALQRGLQAAGSRGYRLIATAEGTDVSGRSRLASLLERDPAGRSFEYAVRVGTGDLSDAAMRSAIDPLFDQGFHFSPAGFVVSRRPEMWLPESAYADQATIVLERQTDAQSGWEYASLVFGTEDAFHSALDTRLREGYEVLGLWNTDRKLHVVLQRSLDGDAAPADEAAGDHRLLLVATRKALKLRLNALARKGYRIRRAEDPPTTGPPILLLQRTAEAGTTLEYRFFSKVPGRMRKDRFADDLDRRARQGWRLTPGGLTDNVFALERHPRHETAPPRATYRLISPATAAEAASSLERALVEGYRLVTMVVEPAQTSFLVERIGAD